jgi:glutathione S-transferase
MSTSINPARLITIPVSHYCEKARWALIRSQIPFIEEPHMPPFYRFTTKKYGDGTVPLLITKDAVLTDSEAILKWADQNGTNQFKLYPTDPEQLQQVEKLVKQFDLVLASAVRQWVYFYTLNLPKVVRSLWCAGTPWFEQLLFPVMYKPICAAITKGYKVDLDSAATSYKKISQTFSMVDSLLADGRSYLVGDQFSAADLAFATLAAPIFSPSGYSVKLPDLAQLPIEMSTKIQQFQASLAGKFGLRLYQEHQQLLNHG